MLVVALFQWWYGEGWRDAGRRILNKIHTTYLGFSVPILLRTLFQPWRRIITYSNGSVQEKFKAMIDNLVSRAVGFVVRVMALIAAGVLVAVFTIAGALLIILWPLLPVLVPILIVGGLL